MKEFLKIMEKDIHKENFSKKEIFVYGLLVPMAFVMIMAVAGWLESAYQ